MMPANPPTDGSRRQCLRATAYAVAMGLSWAGCIATVWANSSASSGGPPASAPPVPPEAVDQLPNAAWSGSARMRVWGFDVYDAALWVAPEFRSSRYAESPLALQLTYLRSLNGRSIAQRSLEEMRRFAEHTPTQKQRWLTAMQQVFPDVQKGDRITGLHQPGVGARFWFNGQPCGAIADPEFSRQVFGIWLADATSVPDLRTALLARATP